MPASTRSAARQAKLEDVGAGNKDAKPVAESKKASENASGVGKKRKAEAGDRKKGPSKQTKKSEDTAEESESVVINRAPVLELWAACVTQVIHPSISWDTCLSAGGAISTITAISKGRSIGTIEKPDPGEAQEKRQKRKEQANEQGLEELEVMSFNLRIKDGQAVVGDKPKKPNEEALRKKYGGPEQYDNVKKAFEEALKTWKGNEDDLDTRAFHMYEDFRPNVKPGQAGWGRKGQLSLDTIRAVAERDG